MPDRAQSRWPSADILKRAVFVNDAGPIRFVDTEAAAKYLSLEAHSLECYRSRGGGPIFYKFGKYVRCAVDDLDAWAESCRRVTTASPAAPRVLPSDLTQLESGIDDLGIRLHEAFEAGVRLLGGKGTRPRRPGPLDDHV